MGIIKLTEKPIGSNPSTNTHFVVTQPETVDGITKESVRRLNRAQVIDDTLSTAGMAADAKAVGDKIGVLKAELNQEKKYQLLLDDSVPNTVQEYTFSGGAVSQVTHKRSGTTIRTDAFTYETSSITEVRTLNTGESMTIATNLETLETSVTYTAA